ncbi:MAG: winged helix-turn-helix transcriptional regulator [Nanohaloarchaea archaeon]|nr:winged helix-turn-helix transcriptional regulator [Candidatus Nanohaloarchaea archaeon]
MTKKTALGKLFGESTVLKILDILMKHPSMDYSKKELAEASGIAESTVHRRWDKIEEINAVKESRKYGKTQLYKLNQDSEVIKQLYKLDQKLRNQKSSTDAVEA